MNLFDKALSETGIYGEVIEVKFPLISIKGLPRVRINETIVFETGELGSVFNIEKDCVKALLYSSKTPKIRSQVAPLGKPLGINISSQFLGKTINPLGKLHNDETDPNYNDLQFRQIFTDPPPLHQRAAIKEAYITGLTKIDLLLPLGKGQRELILGDSKTGKTSLMLSIIEAQASKENGVIIYAGIGKKASEIAFMRQFLSEKNLADKAVIVTSTASDNSSLVYITPYAAMTVAEYFAEAGKDVTVIFDDLSIHAVRYREIALLSNRFPGRESYPGDIFYAHASLLERAGYFKIKSNATYSITCFPIASTVEGDITSYISTNLMSITDGHILFDADIYNKGQRPAVNIPLSVTRVGRQTQSDLLREITVEILSTLASYDKMKNITHLGSEVSEESIKIIKKGMAYEVMLHQESGTIDRYLQVIVFGLANLNTDLFQSQKIYDNLLEQLLKIDSKPDSHNELKIITESKNIKELEKNISLSKSLAHLCKKGPA